MPTENENTEIIISGSAVALQTQAKQVSLLGSSLSPYVCIEMLFPRDVEKKLMNFPVCT